MPDDSPLDALSTTTVPGIDEARERAFDLDEGVAKVRVTRRDISETAQPDDEEYVALKVQACLVDQRGEPVEVGGSAVECPAKVHTIAASALAEGKVDIENERARATVEAVERLKRHRAAMEAWEKLPPEGG